MSDNGHFESIFEEIPAPGAWVKRGRCRQAPLEVFFPGVGDELRTAKTMCRGCPVVDECADYAIPFPRLQGVWGGLSAQERRRRRDEAAAAAAALPPLAPAPAVPAPPRAPKGELDRTLAALMATPGRSARVARYPARGSGHTMASLLRTGRRPRPAGRWTFVGHREPDGTSSLFALYEGPELEATG